MSKVNTDVKKFVKEHKKSVAKAYDSVEDFAEETIDPIVCDICPVPITPPTVIRITLGECQVEIVKSLSSMLETSSSDHQKFRRALTIFKKSTTPYLSLKNEKETIREILDNWDLHGERFNQIMFAIDQMAKSKQGKRK